MSGSIKRINTCQNCVYMDSVVDPRAIPGAKRKLVCRNSPPIGHPVVTVIPSEDGKSLEPRFLGTIAVWPEVELDTWCGRHTSNAIERATDIPKQMQVFGVGR